MICLKELPLTLLNKFGKLVLKSPDLTIALNATYYPGDYKMKQGYSIVARIHSIDKKSENKRAELKCHSNKPPILSQHVVTLTEQVYPTLSCSLNLGLGFILIYVYHVSLCHNYHLSIILHFTITGPYAFVTILRLILNPLLDTE
jgi:hypothetical protein